MTCDLFLASSNMTPSRPRLCLPASPAAAAEWMFFARGAYWNQWAQQHHIGTRQHLFCHTLYSRLTQQHSGCKSSA